MANQWTYNKKLTTGEKNRRILELKEELNRHLDLLVHARESLSSELDSDFAQKKLAIDEKFLRKLKELTAAFNSITDARIRLIKGEKQVENEMTPSEEKESVRKFIEDMETTERYAFIRALVAEFSSDSRSKLVQEFVALGTPQSPSSSPSPNAA